MSLKLYSELEISAMYVHIDMCSVGEQASPR